MAANLTPGKALYQRVAGPRSALGGRLSREHLSAIIAELSRGDSYEVIARRHDTTKQNISLIARKNGLGRR